eukprot:1191134-Prorocentrum_minimum.AAC.2
MSLRPYRPREAGPPSCRVRGLVPCRPLLPGSPSLLYAEPKLNNQTVRAGGVHPGGDPHAPGGDGRGEGRGVAGGLGVGGEPGDAQAAPAAGAWGAQAGGAAEGPGHGPGPRVRGEGG